MRNKLTKFLTSECPPKGMRPFAKTWKYAACMLLAFILGIGQMWGANGDVLFTQDFNSATAVSQNLGAAAVDIDKESGNNIFGVTYTNSQFTSLKAAKISNAKGGIAINSKVTSNSVEYDYGKKFGFRSDDTKASFHLVKTTNFASTAPTALKVEMNMYYKQLSSGSNVTASFAIGEGFSDKEKPANSNIHSGFTIKGNGTATFCQFGTTTNLTGYATAMTQNADVTMTWVINHSGGVLKYTDPNGEESSLANNAFDVWVGTTKNVSGAPATTGTKALQNLYIGDCDAKKKFEFYLDDIKVTDLTPCATPSITTQPIGASLAIGDANPELSVSANNTTSYAWKESSDGTSYDGSSTLASTASFTPEVNDAVQTKYYYCELVNSCNASNVVKTNIVTVEVVSSITPVTGVSLDITSQVFTLGGTIDATLTATVAPNEATNKNISWESDKPLIVSVTDNGDGTADIKGLAEGTATITVTTQDGSFTATCNVTVNPDPCHTYFWFSKVADATTAGVTNNEGSFFTTSASGSNGVTSSITIDGVEYAITNKSSNIGNSDAVIVSFTVPADKAGTFYTNLGSSGNSGAGSSRTLYLKKGGVAVVTATDAIYGDGAQHNATIENIPTGTYTLHANNNVRVGMFALKACDADYHTITLDLDGGTGTTSVAAIDGVPAYKPADPTKEHADFVKWVVKSTEADYNWSANVTGDLTLKAVWSNWPTLTLAAGEGATGDPIANQYKAGTEITVPEKPEGFSKGTDVFTGWAYSQAVTVTDGKFTMPSTDLTLTAQWLAPFDFDVKFFQGYGDPDVQIGETQSISTGGHAVAPADPTRTGYAFLGWSYDGTEAHIVDVATYGITAATDFTAVWKQVWTVTFDGAGAVEVENGETVASPDSPTQAGKIFQGWYNGENKYDFSAAVTGNLALESKWAAANPNHFYYTYNDDFHFDGVVYKTPDGKTKDPEAAEASNVALATNPYTLFSGASGITSIVASNGIYDYKKGAGTKHITAYLKLKADDATSNVVFTIASGYTAVLKLKMNGYSSNATISLKKGDDAVTPSGTQEGTAEGKNYGELTYNLAAGEYKLTTANKTLYISHIDLEAEAIPAKTVTYKAGEGTGSDVVDAAATEVADVPSTFTAPTGKVFNGWKDESDNDVEVGTIVTGDMTLTAQWINHYAVTFNMNGHGDAIDPQDIKEGAKATKPADPSESGWDFGGWFTDNGTFEASFDFNTPITAATSLYAKWTADPCPDKKSIVKAVMTSTSTAAVTGYNDNEYAGGYIINNLADGDNAFAYDFGEGSVTGYKLKGSGSAIFATLAKGGFEAGDKVVFAVTKKAGDNKLAVYAAKDKNNVLKLAEIDVADAGIYEYKLKAADIAAIEAAGADYMSIGSYRGDYNPYIYSVELKGCRSWAVMHTLTFKNFDGTATIAAEPLEEGAYASTVAPAAPKITMKRFLGWAEAVDGTPVDLTSYTLTTDKILYAVYEDIVCPTNGTVYKFEIKDELSSENLPTSTDKDMSSYITATGDGYLTYTATANNKATINSDGTIQMKDASAAYLKVELECALAAGDQIRAHVTNNPIRVQVGTTYDSNKDLILAKNAYEFVAITSAMEGKQILYITRSSNGNANLADFEIYRPAKYDVSFNMMGHGSAIADLEDVVEGSKIAAPSPAPTDVDYSFAGWYKENTLENEWKFDVDVVEANTTLYAKWLDKSDATLKSLMYGETEIALEAGVYTYNVSLPAFTSAVPALTAETNNPSATNVIANAAAFDSEGNATSTVTVSPEVGADQVYTVNFAKGVEILLQDVTGSITWNFANAVAGTVNITGTPQVLANYGGVTNDATFESNKLEASGEKFTAGTKANLRANYIHFHTTVQGMLTISYSNTGGSNPARFIYVNGVKYDEEGSANTTAKGADRKVFVPAGDVELVMKDGEGASKNVQIYQIIFKAPDYVRTEMLGNGVYGTICVDHNVPEGGVRGVTVYEIAGREPQYGKIAFDEVTEMEAGVPYVFIAHGNEMALYYGETHVDDPINGNGMYGTFTAQTLTDLDGIYYFAKSALWSCVDLTSLNLPANRAYVKLSEIDYLSDPNPAPGRKRILLGVNGQNAATDVDLLNAAEAPVKMIIDGKMYILRGEKMYDATGRMVK